MRTSSNPAERLRLYRKRLRQGIRVLRVPLRVTQIEDLVSARLLEEEERGDVEAIQGIVMRLFEQALEEALGCWGTRARSR